MSIASDRLNGRLNSLMDATSGYAGSKIDRRWIVDAALNAECPELVKDSVSYYVATIGMKKRVYEQTRRNIEYEVFSKDPLNDKQLPLGMPEIFINYPSVNRMFPIAGEPNMCAPLFGLTQKDVDAEYASMIKLAGGIVKNADELKLAWAEYQALKVEHK